jgi:RNA polymerase sigma-70 factor, ECF subfamily
MDTGRAVRRPAPDGARLGAGRGATVAAIGETSAQMALRDPDIRLMLQVRGDEPGAFEELVERYQHRLVAVMQHLVGNADEAEDLAQEVFLRVFRARKKYRPKSKFSTWLFTIANNLALNSLRSKGRKPSVPLNLRDSGPLGGRPEEQLVHDKGTGPVGRVQRDELAERIRAALETLNERQKMAVVLNKFEEMNYAEIAEVMNLTTKAVKSLLSRARSNLRAALAGYVYMDGQAVPEAAESDEDGP